MTAESNNFQGKTDASPAEQQRSAADEFDGLVAALRDAGVDVIVVADSRDPHTPDSIFPNNWVTFHSDGRVVLYPMEAENRRTERRRDVLEQLVDEQRFEIRDVVDLSEHENNGHFLEGTGSLVLDRINRVAYACLSSRTHLDPLGDFAQQMDYDIVSFDAVDREGVPIYHTNVLMNVGEKVAVICDDAIPDPAQREAVLASLRETDHDIVLIDFDQLESFAGNMLELRSKRGKRILAMSSRAWNSLHSEQQAVLQKNAEIVAAPIDEIEDSAGGSVRCMLAEIHLPQQAIIRTSQNGN